MFNPTSYKEETFYSELIDYITDLTGIDFDDSIEMFNFMKANHPTEWKHIDKEMDSVEY